MLRITDYSELHLPDVTHHDWIWVGALFAFLGLIVAVALIVWMVIFRGRKVSSRSVITIAAIGALMLITWLVGVVTSINLGNEQGAARGEYVQEWLHDGYGIKVTADEASRLTYYDPTVGYSKSEIVNYKGDYVAVFFRAVANDALILVEWDDYTVQLKPIR